MAAVATVEEGPWSMYVTGDPHCDHWQWSYSGTSNRIGPSWYQYGRLASVRLCKAGASMTLLPWQHSRHGRGSRFHARWRASSFPLIREELTYSGGTCETTTGDFQKAAVQTAGSFLGKFDDVRRMYGALTGGTSSGTGEYICTGSPDMRLRTANSQSFEGSSIPLLTCRGPTLGVDGLVVLVPDERDLDVQLRP